MSESKLFSCRVGTVTNDFDIRFCLEVDDRTLGTVTRPLVIFDWYDSTIPPHINPYLYCQSQDIISSGDLFSLQPPTTHQIISRNPFFLLSLMDFPTDVRKYIYRKVFDLYASKIYTGYFHNRVPFPTSWFELYQ